MKKSRYEAKESAVDIREAGRENDTLLWLFLAVQNVNGDLIKSSANESVQKLQATHSELIYYWHGCEICGGASNIADFWEKVVVVKDEEDIIDV